MSERKRWEYTPARRPVAGKAIDLSACPTKSNDGARVKRCRCEPVCKVCGYEPHTAVHGPLYGQPPGSEPYHHEYVPEVQP